MKIKKITYIGKEECQCIKVSAKDEMYVTDEKILTHNTIVACALTEVGWWTRSQGWSYEDVKMFFDKAVDRVNSRMNGHYLGRSIIDSSPFSMESPIDKFIWETAIHDPSWYAVTGSKWDWFPEQFPDFYDEQGHEIHNWDVAFQLFKGGKSDLPKALEGPAEASQYNSTDLIWCPKLDRTEKGILYFHDMAKRAPIEFMRDWAGHPAGSADKIFQTDKELEPLFANDLRNIYTSITADASLPPEHLIWNLIKDRFFTKFLDDWVFYRNPQAPRAFSADCSTTGDSTALVLTHNEYYKDQNGELIPFHVVDFTINIIPKGGRVSLEAIHCFIKDLKELGGLNIKWVNFDKFQSDNITQNLRREKFNVDYISADKNNEVYTTLIEEIRQGRIACGRNIFLKNNLKSIHITTRDSGSWKYEHTKGKLVHESEDINWETSLIGVNAKDCSDAVAECVYMMQKHREDFIPQIEFIAYKRTDAAKKKVMEDFSGQGWCFDQ